LGFRFFICKELDMSANTPAVAATVAATVAVPVEASTEAACAEASRRDFIKKGAAAATFFSTLMSKS
jgi:hypothetical protein